MMFTDCSCLSCEKTYLTKCQKVRPVRVLFSNVEIQNIRSVSVLKHIHFVWKNDWASLKKHNGSYGVLVKITVLIVVTNLAFFCHLKKGHFPVS